jgi:hypothetical protein
MLLIHPPVSKPGEPPPGIARLAGALRSGKVRYHVLDANLEGLLRIMEAPPSSSDTWTRRAFRSLAAHLESLRSYPAYRNFSRYQRSVRDLNRLLQVAGISRKTNLSLANYGHQTLSPLRSEDLMEAAERPEDNPFFPYFQERLRRVMEKDCPSVVGFSLNFLSQALSTFAMIGFLKRNFPELVVMVGGGLATSWTKRPGWHNPFSGLVDSFVPGPGETPLLSLLGTPSPAGGIRGLPSYGEFPLGDYLAPGFILPYSGSGGCYWNRCLFCPERAEGNPYRPLPEDRVVGDLEALIAREKPVLVHFLDNAISPVLLARLADHPLEVPWYGFARITDHLADLDFCLSLKKSGCVMLQVGLESGDQGVLDRLGKGIDLETASRVLGNLKRAGISAYVYLLFGTPAETETQARRTLAFTVRHSDQVGFLNLALFNLPAFGPETHKLATRKFYEGDLSLYSNFSHPRGWNRNLVRAFLEKEFKRHPAIAPIVRRDPPIFTSNHAPFFGEGMGSQEN